MHDPKNVSGNFFESLKGSTLFGGVQVFKILIAVIRSKVLAIILGPAGIGVIGLLSSTLDVIYSISNLGLATSAVREISEANKDGNPIKLARTIKIFRKLVWITGLLGLSICLFLSPYWSYVSFGSHDYVNAFALLSLTILFRLLSEGQNGLLQGTQNLRFLAKSNIYGNALGLLISLPLYYYWGIGGIAPSLFFFYLINLLISWFYSNKIKIEKVTVSFRETLNEGQTMLKLGFYISLSGLLTTGAVFIVRLFISNKGGLDDVGLYTAGFAIVNTYIGMIFTAMGTEYFPRLSSLSKHNVAFSEAINHQMEISILLTAPLVCLFIIFSDIGIRILYSNEFLGIDLMICYAILAILFKAPSWCCSYAIIAKGDSGLFFFTELAYIVVMLVANIFFYSIWGLTGLGIAYIVAYCYYMIQEWLICKKKYSVFLSMDVIKSFVPHFVICFISFFMVLFLPGNLRYFIGLVPVASSVLFSYKRLSNRIDIIGIIKSRLK